MRTSLPLLCAGALAALSCSSDGTESPRPASMDPSTGSASTTTPVIIRGDGFLALPSEQQSGGAVLDARHRAWLDDAELQEVTWVDAHTLRAVVPAGLPPGPKRLLVENAFGQRGALEGAFTVIGSAAQTPAALTAALAVEGNPTTVLVGQALKVTLTVTNTGQSGANVTRVTPSPVGACTAPSPAPPQVLAGLGSVTYTWTCTALAAGELTLGASVAGVAASNGAGLQANAPGVVLTVQLPAELTATIVANRSTVNAGQAVTATFTLTNGGTSTANVTSIARATSGSAAASCTAPTPAPGPIPTGATRSYTWTCTPSTAGTLVLSGTATGTDAVSGAPLSATPATPASVAVQTPAALSSTLEAVPTTVVVGQAVALTLTVQNTGGASAVVSSVVPLPAASCGAVSPLSRTIAGGASGTFTWTCTASSQGTLTLDATVSASDTNSGAALSPPVAPVGVTVLSPAALTATIGADPSTVNVGQVVNVTFTLTNGGTSTANITAVSPIFSGVAATCEAVSPAPAPIPAGKSSTFGWTCTPAAAGTLSLSGTATGTDAVSGATLTATPASPASVVVQTAAALSATLGAAPATANVGQPVTLTLTVMNQGQAPANVTGVTVGSVAGATCTSPSPAPPQSLLGDATIDFSWTCTPTVEGILTVAPTVSAVDTNTGANVSPAVLPLDVTVQPPAALAATLNRSPSTVPKDQNTPVALTLELRNVGLTTARVTGIAPTKTGNVVCDDPGSLPQDIVPEATGTFGWTCWVNKTTTLGATVTATDSSTGAAVPATVSTVTVTAI